MKQKTLFTPSNIKPQINLETIDEQIKDFTQRIISTLKLHQSHLLQQKKILVNWLRSNLSQFKINHQKYNKNSILLFNHEQLTKENHSFKKDLNQLYKHLKKGIIPPTFQFLSDHIPQDISQLVQQLKGKKLQDFYGFVKGPFISDYFISKRKDFHEVIQQKGQNNKLKLIMIQQKFAHQYQRNLIQQIFGRVLRKKGCLSLVIKIERNVDPQQQPYNQFCYIQDRKLKDEINWKPLSALNKNQNQLYIQDNNNRLQISQIGLLQIFLSQILVLPLQSLVPDYIVWNKFHSAQLVKYNQQSQQQIIKQKNLRDHSSLRNPLLYFRQYINTHSIKISQAQKVSQNISLYSSFYSSLQIVVNLIVNDFSTQVNGTIINSSVCFNYQVFNALWITFHKIILLSGWMRQVISPIKSTITIHQIIQHFCPIFNSIIIYDTQNFQNYRNFLLNLQMQSYLAMNVKKNTLEKYKDMYVSINQTIVNIKLNKSCDVYNHIFRPIFDQINLHYSDPAEVAYIFNFCCKCFFQYQPVPQQIQKKWKQTILWQKCIKFMQKKQLLFIDIGFDFMAYVCGVNTYQIDKNSFQRIRFTKQTQILLIGVRKFVDHINKHYQKQCNKILSSLFQKSFKYNKFKVCSILVQCKIGVQDFQQIIKASQIQDLTPQQNRYKILNYFQKQSLQMHRLYTWQQMMLVHLKTKSDNSIQVQSFQYGPLYFPKSLFENHIKSGRVINNLSRKDYRFNVTKQISFIDLGVNIKFYLQSSQFPLMPYFYKYFFAQLGVEQLMFNFTSFLFQNKMYTISEYLPGGFNFKKGLTTYSQQELCSMTNLQLLSQAIILSMILLPSQIKLQNIIISPSKVNYGEILVIDWHFFYNKNFMCKYQQKVRLNTKNSLFLLHLMNQSINKQAIKKFRDIEVLKICENIFEKSKLFIQQLDQKISQQQNNQQKYNQHLNFIFQNGFFFNFAQRMFKIQRTFNQQSFTRLSFYQLLQILHSQTSFYYQQIYSSHECLKKRQQILFDQDWKKYLLHSTMIQFFGSLKKLQVIQNLFPVHYFKFCFKGPTESLADAANSVKKFQTFSKQNPKNFENSNNQLFQYIMKNIDISKYTMQQGQQFKSLIKNKSIQHQQKPDKKVLALSFIRLQSIVTSKKLMLLDICSFDRVQQLIIQSSILNNRDIQSLQNALNNVHYLELKDIQGVQFIGKNTHASNSIEIKHLKMLSLSDCNQLVSINLKCDILECMSLRNNQKLQSVFIHSNDLKNINIFNNPNIHVENIGVYILKGVNVLMCKSSCQRIQQKIFSPSYAIYVSNILKSLLIGFFVRQSKYIMLLTLLKMKKITSKMFQQSKSSKFFQLPSVFTDSKTISQDNLLIEIFALYFSNPNLHEIVIGQSLISLTTKQKNLTIERLLKLIYTALTKIPKQKQFNSIKLSILKFFFQNLNQQNVKNFIDVIHANKQFTLALEQVGQNPPKYTQQLVKFIRYISIKKYDIQKLTLSLKNSTFSLQLFSSIFKDTCSLKQMMKSPQQALGQSTRSKSGVYSKKRSVNDQYPNHMKIQRIFLESCQITETLVDSSQIIQQEKLQDILEYSQQQYEALSQDKSLEQAKQTNQKEEEKKNIPLKKQLSQKISYFISVKQLIIKNCHLQSFKILQHLPSLSFLSISSCTTQQELSFSHDKLKLAELFLILKNKQLQILQLQNLFTNTQQSHKLFQKFCSILPKIHSLLKLRLTNNKLNFSNLFTINKIINQTNICQLLLDKLTLSQKTINFKISYLENKTELIQQKRQQKQIKNSQHLLQFLSNTTKLQSLTIQLTSTYYLKQFIKSISNNKSIVQLKLNTKYQIQSDILNPLIQNTTLTKISSNMQLPVWLLAHAKKNYKSKGNIKSSNSLSNEQFGNIKEDSFTKENQDNLRDSFSDLRGSQAEVNGFPKSNDFYRIGLSMDGGGIRGMLLATQLEYLVRSVGYPLHKIFDCIGGTSIGGILALLAAGTLDGQNPMSTPIQLMQLFTKHGNNIFKKTAFRKFKNLYDTKYSATSFQELLKNYFKDCKLSDCFSETCAIVTAVNRKDNNYFIFRSNQAMLNRQKDFYMRDVARATSAAPTYFPSAQITNLGGTEKYSMLDGGVGLNNPSKLVIDQVIKISSNSAVADNYFLLSLGTGRLPSEAIPEKAGLKHISPIIDSFSESSNYFLQRDLSINYKGHFYRVSPSIRLAAESKGQLDDTSDQIIETYKSAGYQSSKKYFHNTVIFGQYRNKNLIEWLRQNTKKKLGDH